MIKLDWKLMKEAFYVTRRCGVVPNGAKEVDKMCGDKRFVIKNGQTLYLQPGYVAGFTKRAMFTSENFMKLIHSGHIIYPQEKIDKYLENQKQRHIIAEEIARKRKEYLNTKRYYFANRDLTYGRGKVIKKDKLIDGKLKNIIGGEEGIKTLMEKGWVRESTSASHA